MHKSIAIPIVDTGQGLKYLLVHDKRHHEWTFVTGGCKHKEIFNPIKCAVRELEEETRGTLRLQRGYYKYFRFSAQPSNDPIEYSIYHVYIFHIGSVTEEELSHIEKQFFHEKELMDTNKMTFQKNHDENDSMKFVTLDEILECKTLWKFIFDKVISHKNFYACCEPSNALHFNLTQSIDDENKKRNHRANKQALRSG